jgi:hypothetical protein
MSFKTVSSVTIIKCTEPTCQATFSAILYVFEDDACIKINAGHMVPLTGKTPYYCPCCGKNLGKSLPNKQEGIK